MAVTFVPNPALEVEVRTDVLVQAAVMGVGAEALAFAQSHAPVATGRLRNSLRLERADGGGARVSVNVDYWLFPEYGTVNMPPEPYLRPALAACGLSLT